MDKREQAKLSKAILDMKFMKKSKERVEQEEDDAEGQAMYSSEVSSEMRKSGNVNFIDVSITVCNNLIEGRLSFGGKNPEIQKLMKNEYSKNIEEAEKKKEKDITDVEMAKGYSTLVDNIGKKFQNKRHKNSMEGKKFLKPSDDPLI